jgi:dihydroneopterin triphosphate diphosphatase
VTPDQSPRSPIIRVFDCHIARPAQAGAFEYLLLQRSSQKIYAGTWRMVGGKLHAGEAAWQACLREVGEETQLPVERLLTVPYINRFYEWQHDRINDIPVFIALTSHGSEPVLDAEHCAAAWLPIGEALARLPWPGQREGLKAADALLKDDLALHAFMEIALEG